jgi:Tol biopolymer transport system component
VRPLYDPAGWTDTRIEVQHRRESPVLPSPDGRLVARNRTVYPDPTKPPLYRFATDVVELATGKSLELNVPENTVAVGWFPDGRSVLAHWTDPADRPPMTVPKTRLLRAPIGGGEPTVLVEDAPFTAGGVSPDGKAVLGAGYGTYSEREQRAPYGIVTLDLESKKWAPVAFPADATFATGVWSPDGKRIAYHGIHGKPDPRSAGLPRVTRVSVTVCDRDGGNPRTIFEVKGDEALGSVSLVGWYPAGR